MSNFIRLRRIYGEAFRGYAEPFSVDLPESGLLLIRGINQDTGDTSDAGKSTIPMVAAHVIGGCPYPAKSLQNWHVGKKVKMRAGIILGTPAGDVVAERRIGTGLSVKIGDDVVVGDAAEERLDTIFGGMNAKLRAATTYCGQDTPSLFLAMDDAEKKAILAKLIPSLDDYEAVSVAAGKAVKALESDVAIKVSAQTAAEARLSAAEVALSAAEVALSELGAPQDVQAARRSVEEASRDAGELRSQIARLGSPPAFRRPDVYDLEAKIHNAAAVPWSAALGELYATREICTARSTQAAGAEAERRREIEAEAAGRRIRIAGLEAVAKTARAAAGDLGVAANRLAELEAATCFTCKRPWTENQDAIVSAKADIVAARARIETAEAAIAEIAVLRAIPTAVFEPHPLAVAVAQELADVNRQIAAAEADETTTRQVEICRVQDEIDARVAQASALYETARVDFNAGVESFRDRLRAAETVLADRRQVLAGMEVAAARRAERTAAVDACQRGVIAAKAGVAEASTVSAAAAAKLAEERDIVALTGRSGFVGAMVQEVVNEIADTANEIAAGIANIRNVVFRFDPDAEMEKIVPSVIIDGEARPLGAALSGGQGTSIKRAVDFAFGAVVSRRRGVYPGWLVLDESFNGQGPVSKEETFEMLSRFAAGRLIICIDHATEATGMFDHVINTETVDRRSRIV
jgi:hypothetical protein